MMSVPRYLSRISSSILSAPGSGSIPFSIAATAASAKVLAFCGERVGDSSTVEQRYFLDALFVKREGKMVVIDHVMALLRSENYGNHMLAQEFGAFRVALLK